MSFDIFKIYLLLELVCSYDKLNKYAKRIRVIGTLRWKFFFPISNRDSHNWENTRKVFFLLDSAVYSFKIVSIFSGFTYAINNSYFTSQGARFYFRLFYIS